MRIPVVAMACVLLVASLVSPSVAVAKGGNGRHSVADRKASVHQTAKTRKGRASTAAGANRSGATSGPKLAAAPHKATSKARGRATKTTVEKAAPKTPATKTTVEKAVRPSSANRDEPAGTTPTTEVVVDVPLGTDLTDERIPSDTVGASEVETRGVLDTIRVELSESLAGIRTTVAGMWSAIATFFGD